MKGTVFNSSLAFQRQFGNHQARPLPKTTMPLQGRGVVWLVVLVLKISIWDCCKNSVSLKIRQCIWQALFGILGPQTSSCSEN